MARVCTLPECAADLDKLGVREDALYCCEAHSKRHRRRLPDQAARIAERPSHARTGMRPPTRYAILKVIREEPLRFEVVGYRRGNKGERAIAASRRSPTTHIAIPARDLRRKPAR